MKCIHFDIYVNDVLACPRVFAATKKDAIQWAEDFDPDFTKQVDKVIKSGRSVTTKVLVSPTIIPNNKR